MMVPLHNPQVVSRCMTLKCWAEYPFQGAAGKEFDQTTAHPKNLHFYKSNYKSSKLSIIFLKDHAFFHNNLFSNHYSKFC
jgi:hypothetical protein